MTTDFKQLIEALTEEALDEVLRKFNVNYFRGLGSPEQRIAYAKENLPEMGYGSSRAVFALSGGKVLKIARNKAGYAQNRSEYEIFRDPRTKNVVTAIYDFDRTMFAWIVSEIANPLKSDAQFQQLSGVSFHTYVAIMRAWDDSDETNKQAFLSKYIQEWQDKLDDLEAENRKGQIYNITQRRLQQYQNAANSNFVRTMMDLVKESLSIGDVARIDPDSDTLGHYGYTADNRIVLLDYGFTRDVAQKYYSPSGHAIDPVSLPPAENIPQPPPLPGQEQQPQRQPVGSVPTRRPGNR